MSKIIRSGVLLLSSVSAIPVSAQDASTPTTAGSSVATPNATLPSGSPAVTGAQGPAAPTAESSTAGQNTSAAPPIVEASPNVASGETGIADIVVTATRREERLQRIPVTVTAITGAGLAGSGITDTRSLTQVVPGLNFGRQGLVSAPAIRGVGSSGVSNGDESNVALYIDGVYQADATTTQLDLVQVDRVEVLRGPQGTTFGRNATGGLINVITPDPKFDPAGSISGSYGRMRNDAALYDIRGYITAPVNDVLAIDFAGVYRHNDGYVRRLGTGGVLGSETVYNLRSKLLYQPTERAKLVLTLGYAHQDGQGISYEGIANLQGSRYPGYVQRTGPWQAGANITPYWNYRKKDASLRTSFNLGAVQLETTSAFQDSHSFQNSDQDATTVSLGVGGPDYRTEALSQEIKFSSKSAGPLTWLAGAYAFRLTSNGDILVANPAGTTTAPIPGLLNFRIISPALSTTSFAGFVEATYKLTSQLFVTAGVRYTTEKRAFEQGLSNPVFGPSRTVSDVPIPGVRTIIVPRTSKRFNKATYRLAARYQLTPSINVYGSYGSGFKSGVYNVVTTAITAANPGVVEPETIRAAEVGIKTDINRHVRINLSGYNYQYKNLQVAARAADSSYVLQNAATAKIYGGEAEITLIPTQGLTLTTAAAYTHARYSKFPAAQCFRPYGLGDTRGPGNEIYNCNATGNNLLRAPDFTFSFSPRYEFDVGSSKAAVGANVFHSSRVYHDFANNFSQKPYALINANASFRMLSKVEFSLSVLNLMNKVVFQQIRFGVRGTDVLLERPRRILGGIKYTF